MVGGRRIELLTSSVSRKRSPTELTAPGNHESVHPACGVPRIKIIRIALSSLFDNAHVACYREKTFLHILHEEKGETAVKLIVNATMRMRGHCGAALFALAVNPNGGATRGVLSNGGSA
jgi:hypothetical protein